MASNYEKSIYKQLEDEIIAHEASKAKIDALRIEISDLKAEIAAMKARHAEEMKAAIQAAVEEAVKAATEPLFQEILRLKAIIGKDSSNSSKPPSSDGFKTPRAKVQNSREQTGKKPGGQKGHKGHTLELPENIEELIAKGEVAYEVEEHGDCSGLYSTKYEIGIQIKAIITEHRYPIGSKIPPEHANNVFYGDSAKALALLLSAGDFVPFERLSELFSQLTNGVCAPTEGMLAALMPSFAKKLDAELESVKQDLLNSEVMHTDDTPLKTTQKLQYAVCGKGGCGLDSASCSKECGEPEMASTEGLGKTMQAYARTYSNERSTLYAAQARKDAGGLLRDGIIELFFGILSHDHDAKLYRHGGGHATCCEHLCRDLKELEALYSIKWAQGARSFFYDMNARKNRDLELNISECDPEALEAYMDKYDAMAAEGRAYLKSLGENGFGAKELNAMLNRLEKYKSCYTLFMRDYRAPFTNNLAERDLRMIKAKQKISGCFRSWGGITSFLAIRSFLSTAHKRGLNLLESIEKVFKGEPVFAI